MSLEKLGPQQASSGTQGETPVFDASSAVILKDILKKLEILILHMEVMTDNTFDNQET